MNSHILRSILLLAALTQLWGCLLVRTTEHRVRLNKDGSGEALMRLIDIRSDGETDSAVIADFEHMMVSYRDTTIGEFEVSTRKVTTKQFLLSGDTLMAEIAYTFAGVMGVEGLRATEDELYVVVGAEREVVKTNGKIQKAEHGGVRIVWDRDAERLFYQIRERTLPPSASLAALYRRATK